MYYVSRYEAWPLGASGNDVRWPASDRVRRARVSLDQHDVATHPTLDKRQRRGCTHGACADSANLHLHARIKARRYRIPGYESTLG